MADVGKSLDTNAPGDFFVDETCIDCDTCRWIAPATFDEAGEHSRVHSQPSTTDETLRALMALVACPTASIGTRSRHDLRPVLASYPDRITNGVYHCGYHHEASFGAASYLVVRPEGNVLVDSPRFAGPLVKRLEALGGVDLLFLTHRDDVADHEKFRSHFGCDRMLHEADLGGGVDAVERPFSGRDPVNLAEDLRVIPVPGHTRGSACLLYENTFLFSGDHLAWSPRLEQLIAFRNACWYDWRQLRASMKRLSAERFAWVLPGHGRRCHFSHDQMAAQMRRCLDWIETVD